MARSQTLKLLSNPVLTGMTGQEVDELVASWLSRGPLRPRNAATPGAGADAATPQELACVRCSPTPTA